MKQMTSALKTKEFLHPILVSRGNWFCEEIGFAGKILGIMKGLSLTLSRKELLKIYKTFVRSHLEYADIIYNWPFNDAFKGKLENVQ